MIDKGLKWKGHVKVSGFDLAWNPLYVIENDNVVTNVGKNAMRDALTGRDIRYKYMASGTGTTAADATQTALVTEHSRKAVTSFTAGATGIMVTKTYLGPNDANVGGEYIKELGWIMANVTYADPSAAGQGDMAARVVPTAPGYQKNNQIQLIIERTDTIA